MKHESLGSPRAAMSDPNEPYSWQWISGFEARRAISIGFELFVTPKETNS